MWAPVVAAMFLLFYQTPQCNGQSIGSELNNDCYEDNVVISCTRVSRKSLTLARARSGSLVIVSVVMHLQVEMLQECLHQHQGMLNYDNNYYNYTCI